MTVGKKMQNNSLELGGASYSRHLHKYALEYSVTIPNYRALSIYSDIFVSPNCLIQMRPFSDQLFTRFQLVEVFSTVGGRKDCGSFRTGATVKKRKKKKKVEGREGGGAVSFIWGGLWRWRNWGREGERESESEHWVLRGNGAAAFLCV